jgi:hypothetical protein
MAGSPRTKLTVSSPAVLWLAATLAFAPPALSAGTLYRYQDEQGAIAYTDSRDRIPERARAKAQALDGDTLEPIAPGAAAAPRAGEVAPAPLGASVESSAPAELPPWRQWIDRLADLTIPLPSSYETGVGLTALVLIVWGIVIIRMTASAMVKLLVKVGLLVVAGGAAYALYFSGLSDRVAGVTGRLGHTTVTGKELLGAVEEKTGKVAEQLKRAATDRLKDAAGKAKEAAVGEASRTVEQANESSRRLQEQLERLEPARPSGKP